MTATMGIEYDPNRVEEFSTGAHRSDRTGKGRFDLIPPSPLLRLAIHYEAGGNAYGDWNWEKGMVFSRLLDSALRHINQYRAGKRNEDHLAAAVWNLFAVMHFEELKPYLNDLPKFVNMEDRACQVAQEVASQKGVGV